MTLNAILHGQETPADLYRWIHTSLRLSGNLIQGGMRYTRGIPLGDATEILGILEHLATATAEARERIQELADEYRGHMAGGAAPQTREDCEACGETWAPLCALCSFEEDPDPPGAGDTETD